MRQSETHRHQELLNRYCKEDDLYEFIRLSSEIYRTIDKTVEFDIFLLRMLGDAEGVIENG